MQKKDTQTMLVCPLFFTVMVLLHMRCWLCSIVSEAPAFVCWAVGMCHLWQCDPDQCYVQMAMSAKQWVLLRTDLMVS